MSDSGDNGHASLVPVNLPLFLVPKPMPSETINQAAFRADNGIYRVSIFADQFGYEHRLTDVLDKFPICHGYLVSQSRIGEARDFLDDSGISSFVSFSNGTFMFARKMDAAIFAMRFF